MHTFTLDMPAGLDLSFFIDVFDGFPLNADHCNPNHPRGRLILCPFNNGHIHESGRAGFQIKITLFLQYYSAGRFPYANEGEISLSPNTAIIPIMEA
jgi:hypothetical protein